MTANKVFNFIVDKWGMRNIYAPTWGGVLEGLLEYLVSR